MWKQQCARWDIVGIGTGAVARRGIILPNDAAERIIVGAGAADHWEIILPNGAAERIIDLIMLTLKMVAMPVSSLFKMET